MPGKLVLAAACAWAAVAVSASPASAGLILFKGPPVPPNHHPEIEFAAKRAMASFEFLSGIMLGYPAAAGADLSWDLRWDLNGSARDDLALTPMSISGTAYQQASRYPGGYQACSSAISVNDLSPQRLVQLTDNPKTGEPTYRLALPLELGLAVKTCYGLGTGWFAVGSYNPPVCASYGTAQIMNVPVVDFPVIDTQPQSCDYTHPPAPTDDSKSLIKISWSGKVTVTYPPDGGTSFILKRAKVITVILRAQKAAVSTFDTLKRRGAASLNVGPTLGGGIRSVTMTLARRQTVIARGTLTRGRRLRFVLTRAGRRTLRAPSFTATLTTTVRLASGRIITAPARGRITR